MKAPSTLLGVEPTLGEVMADPITRVVMQSDNVASRDVFAAIERSKSRRALAPKWLGSPFPRSDSEPASGGSSHPLCRLSRLCEGVLPLLGSVVALIVLLAIVVY